MLHHTCKCCWLLCQGSGGCSGTRACSEMRLCCCPPPPSAQIPPSIHSSAWCPAYWLYRERERNRSMNMGLTSGQNKTYVNSFRFSKIYVHLPWDNITQNKSKDPNSIFTHFKWVFLIIHIQICPSSAYCTLAVLPWQCNPQKV